jgi:hypothetical protein
MCMERTGTVLYNSRLRGGVVDMPYSKVDTALGNKKGSLLNYGR